MKNRFLLNLVFCSSALLLVSCKKEVTVTKSTVSSEATNSVDSNFDLLPSNAQAFLNQHFPEVKTMTISEKTIPIIGKSFEVKLGNGFEVDFDSNGDWHEISGNKQALPIELIPEYVTNYLKENNNNVDVISIDKEKKEVSVELSNGVDLLFDESGKFLKID